MVLKVSKTNQRTQMVLGLSFQNKKLFEIT
jgi:hypothetical protein